MGFRRLTDGRVAHDDVPEVCPNGHPLGPGQVHISYARPHGRIYECATCHAEIRRPG